jgi:hypothetical protein
LQLQLSLVLPLEWFLLLPPQRFLLLPLSLLRLRRHPERSEGSPYCLCSCRCFLSLSCFLGTPRLQPWVSLDWPRIGLQPLEYPFALDVGKKTCEHYCVTDETLNVITATLTGCRRTLATSIVDETAISAEGIQLAEFPITSAIFKLARSPPDAPSSRKV